MGMSPHLSFFRPWRPETTVSPEFDCVGYSASSSRTRGLAVVLMPRGGERKRQRELLLQISREKKMNWKG